MQNVLNIDKAKLFLFSVAVVLICYGFALTNYTLTVDSESPIYDWYSLQLGRWGTNLIRYHIFHGLIPYFTLLLGVLFFALSSVELTKIFRLDGIKSYIFCALFLTIPQMAYQFVFTMQADVIGIGFFAATVGIRLFIDNYSTSLNRKSLLFYILGALLIMFAVACYQGLALVPVVIFIIYFFQSTFDDQFQIKEGLKKSLFFGALMAVSAVLYFISVKIFCKSPEGALLSSYTDGEAPDRLKTILNVLQGNIRGKFYYGNRLFPIAALLLLLGILVAIKNKKHAVLRILALFAMLILPYGFSFFITSGYHPPRIYLTTGIVFAFIIVHFLPESKFQKTYVQFCGLICLVHIYFITSLFYSANTIYNHDKEIAKKMNTIIYQKYPTFDPATDYVYFYGCLPQEHHEAFRLQNSEIFGGSLFTWDNGSNWRINNFFKATDIANYKFLDNKDAFMKVKDSINSMPVWPNYESVKKVENVVIIKLGTQKGAPLPFE